ncbi:DUF6268 family outer membrane beta-barrel protein [Fulvivirga ligni]|uniref:DUF6268 family outer membrane beta-barrel protein n=1 Tax=Fulvivirga ligni TaxID=2904246 RepID=UPI001F45DF71|nr:DUF6268 family outer membrane beta-barrel protein [Fulvivirga ligni]UII22354.1 DUF6268 family outer membrane beta-barrel protein [Fulvivirga ligni]
MMRYLLVLFAFTHMNCGWLLAQDVQNDNVELESNIIPYRPRIAEITLNNLYDYNISSNSDAYGNANSEMERDTQMKIRLGVPIIMKGETMFGVQFKYDRHNFVMDKDYDLSHYELYDHIESHKFTSLGGRFLFQQGFDKNKQITVVAGAEMKSDLFKWQANTTKYYALTSYEVTLNKNTKIGTGLSLGYTLTAFQIYPFLSYEHKLSPKFTMDLYLPKSAALRYKVNHKFYITGSAEVKGWRYAVSNNELAPNEILTLRKSDLYLGLSFEHEIYDWLWFGFDPGYAINLRSYLARPGDRRRDALIELNADNAPYARFSLFIVPPKKFYK